MIADLLGIQKSTIKNVASLNEKLKTKTPRKRPPPGIAREVLQLCGDNLVSLPVQLQTPEKTVSNTLNRSVNKWRWSLFKNSAHPARIHLHQWYRLSEVDPFTKLPAANSNSFEQNEDEAIIRKTISSVPDSPEVIANANDESEKSCDVTKQSEINISEIAPKEASLCCDYLTKNDFPAATFNKKAQVVRYTQSIYQKLLSNINFSWTRWETDYLFQLCIQYDLRFIVIFDRYRPMEEILLVLEKKKKQTNENLSKNESPVKQVSASLLALESMSVEALEELLQQISKYSPRSICQLKERYYSIAKRLLEHEHLKKLEAIETRFSSLISSVTSDDLEALTQQKSHLLTETRLKFSRHPLIKYQYDQAIDVQRRTYLDQQYRQPASKRDKEEEKELISEIVNANLTSKLLSSTKKEETTSRKKKFPATTTVSSGASDSINAEEEAIPIRILKSQLICLRKPGTLLASHIMQQFGTPYLLQPAIINIDGVTSLEQKALGESFECTLIENDNFRTTSSVNEKLGSMHGTKQSQQTITTLSKKHEHKIQQELESLGFGRHQCPLWPAYTDREVVEAFNALRIDVAIMINYQTKVENLLKEKAIWKTKISQLTDDSINSSQEADQVGKHGQNKSAELIEKTNKKQRKSTKRSHVQAK